MKKSFWKSWSKESDQLLWNKPSNPLFCSDKYPTPRYCPSPESTGTLIQSRKWLKTFCFSRRDGPCFNFRATWRLTVEFFSYPIIAKVCSFHKERLYLLNFFLPFCPSSFSFKWYKMPDLSYFFPSFTVIFLFLHKIVYTCIWVGNKTGSNILWKLRIRILNFMSTLD